MTLLYYTRIPVPAESSFDQALTDALSWRVEFGESHRNCAVMEDRYGSGLFRGAGHFTWSKSLKRIKIWTFQDSTHTDLHGMLLYAVEASIQFHETGRLPRPADWRDQKSGKALELGAAVDLNEDLQALTTEAALDLSMLPSSQDSHARRITQTAS